MDVVTLRAVSTGLAEGQAPLKVVWAKEGALLPQGEALDARLKGRLRQALKEAGLKAGESLLLYTEEGPVLLFGRG